MNPLTALRAWIKFRPIINQLNLEVHMKFSWNLVVQILGTVGQGLNQASVFATTEKSRTGIALGVGVLQAVAALIAHYSNPDGTSASSPYVKPAKAQ